MLIPRPLRFLIVPLIFSPTAFAAATQEIRNDNSSIDYTIRETDAGLVVEGSGAEGDFEKVLMQWIPTHWSAGVYGSGLYICLDAGPGLSAWTIYFTQDQLLNGPTPGYYSSMQNRSLMEMTANEKSGQGDPRMVAVSTISGTPDKLLIVAKDPDWTGGPSVSAWMRIPWQPPSLGEIESCELTGEILWIIVDHGGRDFNHWFNLTGWPGANGPSVERPPAYSDQMVHGDINGDGSCDTSDLGIILNTIGTGYPLADMNGDGIVDTADLGIFLAIE